MPATRGKWCNECLAGPKSTAKFTRGEKVREARKRDAASALPGQEEKSKDAREGVSTRDSEAKRDPDDARGPAYRN